MTNITTTIYVDGAVTSFDIDERCTDCGESTAPGTGRYVNRISSVQDADAVDWDWQALLPPGFDAGWVHQIDGYLCADCRLFDCDRCAGKIGLDDEFILPDGDVVCWACINEDEYRAWLGTYGLADADEIDHMVALYREDRPGGEA